MRVTVGEQIGAAANEFVPFLNQFTKFDRDSIFACGRAISRVARRQSKCSAGIGAGGQTTQFRSGLRVDGMEDDGGVGQGLSIEQDLARDGMNFRFPGPTSSQAGQDYATDRSVERN